VGKGSKRRPENQKAYRDAYAKVLGWDEHPLGALSIARDSQLTQALEADEALEALERLEVKRKRRDPDHLEMLIDRLDMSDD
tara:strand:- start:11 stop:256 length:246 start_codon:yes stop_codon:yes gene_type:complete